MTSSLWFQNSIDQAASLVSVKHYLNVCSRGKQGVILRKVFTKLYFESAKNERKFRNRVYIFGTKLPEPVEDEGFGQVPPGGRTQNTKYQKGKFMTQTVKMSELYSPPGLTSQVPGWM